jgi:opacity protein-like surface antigen
MNHATSRLFTIMCLSFVMTIAAAEARAQSFVSPFLGYNFGGDSVCPEVTGCEEKNLNYGVGFGRMGNVVGFEEEFGYARNFFGNADGPPELSSSVLTVMSNFMIVPNLGPVRPFGLVGLGLIKSHVEFTPESVLDADNNHFGWNVGGGLMLFFGDHVGVRGEIRYFHSFQDLEFEGFSIDGTKLDFGRVGGALVIKF